MKYFRVFLLISALVLLCGCVSEQPGKAESTAAQSQSQSHPQAAYQFGVGYSGSGYTDSMERWSKLVYERTDGQVELKLFGDNALGEGPEMAKAVQRGTLSIVASSTSVCTDLVPQAAIMDLPSCYSQYIQLFRVYNGEFYEMLNRYYRQQGLELLFLRTGEDWIISASEPISSLAALNGLRVRTSGSTYHNKLYDSLGIQRLENVGLSGLPYILQEGRVDGIEATYTILKTQGLLESQPYGIGSLFVMSSAVTMNLAAFESLPKEYQIILKESLQESLTKQQKNLQQAAMERDMVITALSETDEETLRQLAQPLMEEIRAVAGDELLQALENENAAAE